MGYPLIQLHSGEDLEFHFDEMSTEFDYFNYGVLHCDHAWQQSDLDATEYLQGFPYQDISTFEAGFSTMYEFVHYRFTFPNEMMKPKYSGNYLMVVFRGTDISDRSKWVVTYRIVVYESAVSVTSKVTQSSVIADHFKKQEVDFNINYKDFTIYDPGRDLHVSLLQNLDWEHSINDLKPIFIKSEDLTYDFSGGENTFTAGNEWRNFEMKSLRYASAEVQSIGLEPDGYNVYLRPDLPVGGKAYVTWADLNGNWLVRVDGASDSHLEADYAWVTFKLEMSEIPEAEVFIEGRFNQFSKQPLKCVFDPAQRAYVARALLKQGYYNYRYIVRDRYLAQDDLSFTEGSSTNTENDYHIIVYLYDRNYGCDRVIAIKADNSVRK